MNHPSFLALDAAALVGAPPELAEHLGQCGRCQAYVAQLQRPPDVAPWLTRVRAGSLHPWRWRRAVWALGSVAAVALAVWFVRLELPRHPKAPYVAAKGAPSVSLFVKRGDRVWRWSPSDRVESGDLLRASVAADGFSDVIVATVSGSRWVALYEGPLSESASVDLPTSWRVDDSSTDEQLLFVFSHHPVAPQELGSLAADLPRTDEVWTARLLVAKLSSR